MRVYAVWFSMLDGDDHGAFMPELLTDARVTHLWNEEHTVGRWFADNVEIEASRGEIAWDSFLVFGAAAEWTDKPLPLEASGRTIWRKREALREAVERLLGDSAAAALPLADRVKYRGAAARRNPAAAELAYQVR